MCVACATHINKKNQINKKYFLFFLYFLISIDIYYKRDIDYDTE